MAKRPPPAKSKGGGFQYRILTVDDEPAILTTSKAVLEAQGYEVRTASDGFEALVELRRALPDILISDLSMPNMSGFELLSIVRKRFPQIAVIAISSEYSGGNGGLIADAFFAKGQYAPVELFRQIAAPIAAGAPRVTVISNRTPVWTPLNGEGYYVPTCPECLRSFPIASTRSDHELRHADCTFCNSQVSFLAARNDNTLGKKDG